MPNFDKLSVQWIKSQSTVVSFDLRLWMLHDLIMLIFGQPNILVTLLTPLYLVKAFLLQSSFILYILLFNQCRYLHSHC